VVLAVVAMACIGLALVLVIARDVRRGAPAGLLVAVAVFLAWKAGFVRHDSAHAVVFFGAGGVLAVVAIFVASAVPHFVARLCGGTALAVCVVGIALSASAWLQDGLLGAVPQRIARSVRVLTAPHAWLDAQAQQQREN